MQKQPVKPLYIQWSDTGDPSFLLASGHMIGEWYGDQTLFVYCGKVATKAKARKVLETLARYLATPSGENELTIIQRRVAEIANAKT